MAAVPGDGPDRVTRPDRPSTGPTADQRLLDEVFGEVLPDITDDERDDREEAAGAARERWYQENRPPHHGA